MKTRGVLLTVVAGAMVVALAAPASASTSVQPDRKGMLLARGAAVNLPVWVTCDGLPPPGPNELQGGYVDVQLTQAVGKYVAQGQGGALVDVSQCDGETPIEVPLTVVPNSFGFPVLRFRTGVAFLQAYFQACNYDQTTGEPSFCEDAGGQGLTHLTAWKARA